MPNPHHPPDEEMEILAYAEPRPGWLYVAITISSYWIGKAVFGLRLVGQDNVPEAGPAVLLPNHASYLDAPVIGCLTSRPITFMARRTLFRGIGAYCYPRMNTFPVTRGGADIAAFRKCWEVLDRGHLLCLFPEGTRSPTGEIRPAQPGAISIALRSGAPLIPVAVSGTNRVLQRGHGFRLGRLGVMVGRPVTFPRLTAKMRRDRRVIEAVGRWVMAEIARMKRELDAEILAAED